MITISEWRNLETDIFLAVKKALDKGLDEETIKRVIDMAIYQYNLDQIETIESEIDAD